MSAMTELTADEIDTLVYEAGPDANHDSIVDVVERIVAARTADTAARLAAAQEGLRQAWLDGFRTHGQGRPCQHGYGPGDHHWEAETCMAALSATAPNAGLGPGECLDCYAGDGVCEQCPAAPDAGQREAQERAEVCSACGAPAKGYSSYCPDCHHGAFGGGADIG